ncbi:MAG: hypothetical protein LBQ15_02220 [Clostridium sp.]|nr:hypothetical protein [Clostridium sp.]
MVIFDWVGVLSGDHRYRWFYFSIRSALPTLIGMVALDLVLFLSFFCHWLLKEYKSNQKELESGGKIEVMERIRR